VVGKSRLTNTSGGFLMGLLAKLSTHIRKFAPPCVDDLPSRRKTPAKPP
jgi:hypothetical protein